MESTKQQWYKKSPEEQARIWEQDMAFGRKKFIEEDKKNREKILKQKEEVLKKNEELEKEGDEEKFDLPVENDSQEERLKKIVHFVEEIENPKDLLKLGKKDRIQALKMYQEIVLKKFVGIGKIRTFLLDYLEDNQDIDGEEIISFLKEKMKKYHISEKFLNENVLPVLKKYQKYREQFNEWDKEKIGKFLAKKKLWMDLDKAEIDVDIFDIKVVGDIYKKFTSELLEEDGKMWDGVPVSFYQKDVDDDLKLHEEQHHIMSFLDNEGGELNSEKLDEAYKSARNEILAYYRHNVGLAEVVEKITTSDSYSLIWKKLNNEDKEKFDEVLDILKNEKVFEKLEAIGGFDKEMIIGIFMKIPLERWVKVSQKILKISEEDEYSKAKKVLEENKN